jgi:hypothetical protein
VRLLTERRSLSVYAWGDLEGHNFCPVCGVGLLRTGYPNDHVSVNARRLEGVDVFTLPTRGYDGRKDMPPGPYD